MNNVTSVVGRQARALRILTCLQSGPAFNAGELARQLNVSRRTIFRDLQLIRSAGVQIYFDEQQDGYRLSYQSQCIEPPQFDDRELAEFVLMAHLSVLQGLPGFSASVHELAAKLLCAYPYAVRISITRLLNACVVRVPDSPPLERSTQLLRVIFEAIRRQKQLRVVIDTRTEATLVKTKFAPYRVEMASQRWAVFGRSSIHRGPTTLQMEMIHSAEVTGETYDIPRGFRHRKLPAPDGQP